MSSSKGNMNKASSSNGGGGRAMANGVVLPLQPKGTAKGEVNQWNHATSSNVNGNTQQPVLFGNANDLAGPVPSMQLNGQASRFEPSPLLYNPYMKSLLRDSEPDQSADVVVYNAPLIVHGDAAGKGKGKAKEASPIGTRPQGGMSVNTVFTTDIGHAFQGGHYICVNGVKDIDDWASGVKLLSEDFHYDLDSRLYDIKISEPNDLNRRLAVYLCVDDIKDTEYIFEHLPVIKQQWHLERVSHSAYAAAPGKARRTTQPPLHYDGQVLFIAYPEAPITKERVDVLEKGIFELAAGYGSIHAYTKLITGDTTQLQFRLEFHSIRAAHRLLAQVSNMNPSDVGTFLVAGFVYTERPSQDSDDDENSAAETSANTPREHKTMLNAPGVITTSPTGRTAWATLADGKRIPQKPPVVAPKINTNRAPPQTIQIYNAAVPLSQGNFYANHNAMPLPGGFVHGQGQVQGHGAVTVYDREVRSSRSHGWGTGPLDRIHGGRRDNNNIDPNEPQSINLERLALGHDVRTTIMLRNIPNIWNCHDLKWRLDQICPGKYDFTYLRIDFEKATNVGYGFINLTHPDHVIPFVKAVVNVEWAPGHYPRKLGQISYATIQGIDCLVEKFRNSAIMSEFPEYRPKLWYTAADAPEMSMIGTEKPFPAPNNHTKNQRSHDNAGTVGLFAPRSSQRHGDRSRRSNYDRGTQHQIEEEVYYSGPSYGYDNYTAAARAPIGPPPGAFYPPNGYAMPFFPPPPQYYGYPAYGHPGFPSAHPQWMGPYHQGRPAGRLSHVPRSFVSAREQTNGAAGSSAAAEGAEMAN